MLLCRGNSRWVRLVEQETLTPPGYLVSPLVSRGPWMFTVELCSFAAVNVHQLFYISHEEFIFRKIKWYQRDLSYCGVVIVIYPVSLVLKWFEVFRMEIQNASTTPIKSNQLRNINTARWKSRNITTRPGEIDDRNSEVIAFVVRMYDIVWMPLPKT